MACVMVHERVVECGERRASKRHDGHAAQVLMIKQLAPLLTSHLAFDTQYPLLPSCLCPSHGNHHADRQCNVLPLPAIGHCIGGKSANISDQKPHHRCLSPIGEDSTRQRQINVSPFPCRKKCRCERTA